MAKPRGKPKAEPSDKARVLTVNVAVDGEWYGPDWGNADKVPVDVAERIGDESWA